MKKVTLLMTIGLCVSCMTFAWSSSVTAAVEGCKSVYGGGNWAKAAKECLAAAEAVAPRVLAAPSVDDANYYATLEATLLERVYRSYGHLGNPTKAHLYAAAAYDRAATTVGILHDYPRYTKDVTQARQLYATDLAIMEEVLKRFPNVDPHRKKFPPGEWKGP